MMTKTRRLDSKMKIADNVEMLEIGGMGGTIYPVLVWDDLHLVLVDTGFPSQKDYIVQAISDAEFIAEKRLGLDESDSESSIYRILWNAAMGIPQSIVRQNRARC